MKILNYFDLQTKTIINRENLLREEEYSNLALPSTYSIEAEKEEEIEAEVKNEEGVPVDEGVLSPF